MVAKKKAKSKVNAAGTAIIGNRMEIFETPDLLKYLWLNRHCAAECFRCLLFY